MGPKLALPTVAAEANNPAGSDSVYMSATKWLLSQTRDTKVYSLLFQQNINYGYRRNMLGLRRVVQRRTTRADWGRRRARRCRNQYGRLVAFGIATNFFLYVAVNIAMVMGSIPVGGVPLPLVSHGGSAMIMVMVGFGLLMSVHVHRDVEFG